VYTTAGLSRSIQVIDTTSEAYITRWHDVTGASGEFVVAFPSTLDVEYRLADIRRRNLIRFDEAWRLLANL